MKTKTGDRNTSTLYAIEYKCESNKNKNGVLGSLKKIKRIE